MKKIQLHWIAILVIITLLLVSCSTRVHIDKDDSADFRQYKTFAWIGADDPMASGHSPTELRFKQAIITELRNKGWKIDHKNPDVLVSFDVLMEYRGGSYSRPVMRTYYNPGRNSRFNISFSPRFSRSRYNSLDEGAITITFTDAETEQPVWQGWQTKYVYNRHLSRSQIRQTVKRILKKYDE